MLSNRTTQFELLIKVEVYRCASRLYSFREVTPSESAPSGQFWCIYALIGGARAGAET